MRLDRSPGGIPVPQWLNGDLEIPLFSCRDWKCRVRDGRSGVESWKSWWQEQLSFQRKQYAISPAMCCKTRFFLTNVYYTKSNPTLSQRVDSHRLAADRRRAGVGGVAYPTRPISQSLHFLPVLKIVSTTTGRRSRCSIVHKYWLRMLSGVGL